ncbi:MAG: transglutaminase-like cysteine peptidase [Paracoccaceae bacterium]
MSIFRLVLRDLRADRSTFHTSTLDGLKSRVFGWCVGFLAASLLIAGPVSAGSDKNGAQFMELSREIAPPTGAMDICSRYYWACHQGGNWLPMPRKVVSIANNVNRQINTKVPQITDEAQFGKTEFWTLPTALGGDCEDFVLVKKLELIKRGVPPESLLMASVYSREFGAHAVLVLRTETGDFVLDNLNDQILPWQETGYVFLRVQDPRQLSNWRSVRVAT